MSRNGSGTYSLPAGNPVVTGTTISSSWANNTMNDIASALTDSVAADGQTPMTGNLDLNSNKIVNVTDPTLAQDAATKNYSDTTYLAKASNLSDVANTTTARTNISAAKSGANSDITSLTGLTTPLSQAQGGTGTTTGYYGFKNRIINGAMVIDQRNAGAAVTVNSAAKIYGVDRFFGYGQAADGVFTIDQNTDAPTGFINSTKITTTTADASVGASQFYLFGQSIEGTNVTDLAWGTASAKTVTLSFWVKSSLTGTFGGALTNSAANRSYPFTYTISSANTWEQKSITIAGDTTGTWLTTTGIGIDVWWDLGCGSSNIGTAGSWAAAAYYGATGDTKLISTLNATFYITGVQLEVGSTATSFDYRPYGTELQLCQRYYSIIYVSADWDSANTYAAQGITFPATMRTSATFTAITNTLNSNWLSTIFNVGNFTAGTITQGTNAQFEKITSGRCYQFASYSASAEL